MRPLVIVFVLSMLSLIRAVEVPDRNKVLIQALKSFGLNQVIIVDTRKHSAIDYKTKLLKAASDQNVLASFLSSMSDIHEALSLAKVSILYLAVSQSDYEEFEKLVSIMPPYSCILVDMNEAQNIDISSNISSERNIGFYHATHNDMKFNVFLVLSSKREGVTIINPISKTASGYYKNNFDLTGLTVRNICLDWKPYVNFGSCQDEEKGTDCVAEGIYPEVLEALSKLLNFTLVSDRDPLGNWGSTPINGSWNDPDVDIGGVLGAVSQGTHDVSSAQWIQSSERALWVDYSAPMEPIKMVVITNAAATGPGTFDFTLFLRPFTTQSWFGMLLVLIILLLGILVTYMIYSRITTKPSQALRIALFSVWVLFILFNAFYGGALTMFFTTQAGADFDNAKDGLKLYPQWKMLIPKDVKLEIQNRAEANDKDFQNYLDLIESSEGSDLILSTLSETLEGLIKQNTFSMAIEPRIITELTARPVEGFVPLMLGYKR